MEEIILQDLQQHRFAEVAENIVSYLKPLRTYESQGQSRDWYSSNATKFLWHITSIIGKIDNSVVDELLKSAVECYECCKLHPPKGLKDQFTVQKLASQLIAKALKCGYLNRAVTLSELLLSDVQSLHQDHSDVVKSLSSTVYSYLANLDFRSLPCSEDVVCLAEYLLSFLLYTGKDILLLFNLFHQCFDKFQTIVGSKRQGRNDKPVSNSVLHAVVSSCERVRNLILSFCSKAQFYYIWNIINIRLVEFIYSNFDKQVDIESIFSKDKISINKTTGTLIVCELLCDVCVKCVKETLGVTKKHVINTDTGEAIIEQLKELQNYGSVFSSEPGDPVALHCVYICLQSSLECLKPLVQKEPTTCFHPTQSDIFYEMVTEVYKMMSLAAQRCFDIYCPLVESSSGMDKAFALKNVKSMKTMDIIQASEALKLTLQRIQQMSYIPSSLSSQVISDIHDVSQRVTGGVNAEQYPLAKDEHLHFANIVYTMGRWLFTKKDKLDVVCQVLKISLYHFWELNNISPESTNKIKELFKKFEFAANCQRKHGQLQGAADSLAEGLLLESTQITQAALSWAKLKDEAVKKKSSEDFVSRTLYGHLKVVSKDSNMKLDCGEVLKAEFEALKGLSSVHFEAKGLVLAELAKAATTTCDQAEVLLEKAQLVWETRKLLQKSPQDYCKKAIGVLKGCQKKPTSSSHVYVDDLLAQAYVLHYVVSDVDPISLKPDASKISNKTDTNNTDGNSRPNSPMSKLKEAEVQRKAITITTQDAMMKHLTSALASWEKVVTTDQGQTLKRLKCPLKTLDILALMESIFRLAYKITDQFRTLKLIKVLCSAIESCEKLQWCRAQSNTHFLRAQTLLIQLLCHIKQPRLCEALIQETDRWYADIKIETDKNGLREVYFQYLLVKSEGLLLSNKINEGWKVLQESDKVDICSSRSYDQYLMRANKWRLMAKYFSLPPGTAPVSKDSEDGALSTLVKGTRYVSGVVHVLLGERVVNGGKVPKDESAAPNNILEKWDILDRMLRCVLETGLLFVEIGGLREARSYLPQGVRLTTEFKLPLRLAEFQLALAKLDVRSANYNDCSSHLHTAEYLIQSKTAQKIPQNKTTANPTDDCFGFDNSDTEEVVMKTNNLSFEEEVEELNEELRENLVMDSPSSKREKVKVPEFWSHDDGCECVSCGDLTLQRLGLSYFNRQAEAYLEQGLFKEAHEIFHLYLQHFERLNTTAKTATESMAYGLILNPKNLESNMDIAVEESLFHDVLIDTCLQMSKLALLEDDLESFNIWSNKAEQLLSVEIYPWVITLQMQKAYVQYLQSVFSVRHILAPQESTCDIPALDSLMARLDLDNKPSPMKTSKALLFETPSTPTCKPQPSCQVIGAAAVKLKIGRTKKNVNHKRSSETRTPDVFTLATPSTENVDRASNGNTPQHNAPKVESGTPVLNQAPVKKRPGRKPMSQKPLTLNKEVPSSTRVQKLKPSSKLTIWHDDDTVSSPACKQKSLVTPFSQVISRTPRSVASRKAILDKLMESDSDEGDIAVKKPAKRGTTTANRSKIRGSKIANTSLCTPRRAPTENLFKQMISKNMSSLEENQENVFEFVSSDKDSPEVANKRRGRKPKVTATKKKTVTRKTSKSAFPGIEIEETRDNVESNTQGDMLSDIEEIENTKSKQNGRSLSKKLEKENDIDKTKVEIESKEEILNVKQRPTRTRKTRSKFEDVITQSRPKRSDIMEHARSEDLEDSELIDLSFEELSSGFDESSPMISSDDEIKFHQKHIANIEAFNRKSSSNISFDTFDRKSFTSCNSICFVDQNDVALNISDPFDERKLFDSKTVPQDSDNIPLRSKNYPPWHQTSIDSDDSIEICRGGDNGNSSQTHTKKNKRKTTKVASKTEDAEEMEVPRKTVVRKSDVKFENTAVKKCGAAVKTSPPSTGDSNSIQSTVNQLKSSYNLVKHLPTTPLYRNVCQALAVALKETSPIECAFYLTESQSVTFRHNALVNVARKLRKHEKSEKENIVDNPATGDDVFKQKMAQMKKDLAFEKSVGDLERVISALPSEWTVCQVSVVTSIGEDCGQLYLTQYRAGRQPLIVPVQSFTQKQSQKILVDFGEIMASSKQTTKLTDRTEWWGIRETLNTRLKELLDAVEDLWLSEWRGMMLGQLENTDDKSKFDNSLDIVESVARGKERTVINRNLLEIILQSCHLLGDHQLARAVSHLLPNADTERLADVIKSFRAESKYLELAICTREPIILILDRTLQHIPWESMPMLRRHQVTRLPSLYFLYAQLRLLGDDPGSVYKGGVHPRSVYYVLNPEGDLQKTQGRFENWFDKEKGWEGIMGKRPSTTQFTKALTSKDLFIYCGHGSGNKYLSEELLQCVNCRACVLLMGCSSGQLITHGELDASGLMLNYFLAGCPSVVGCLWDVTDRDIDMYLTDLLQSWLKSSSGSLLNHITSSREVCKLSYLNGAAPVCYGLPIRIAAKKT